MFNRKVAVRSGRGSVLQWGVVGIGGIILGIYTIGISLLPSRYIPLLVLAVLFPLIGMMVGNVRRLLLAAIILDIPLQLDTHLFYRTEMAELGAIGGLGISVTTVCLGILYALWVAEILGRSEPGSYRVVRASLPLALYVAFAGLSVAVARDTSLAFFEIFLLLQMFLLYVYVVSSVETREDVLFIATMLLISLIFESVVIIGLRYLGEGFSVAGISGNIEVGTTVEQPLYRIAGTLGSANGAASYLSLLLAPAMGVLLARLNKAYKLMAMFAFGLGAVALVLTFSRGGWVAFGLSIVILILLAWKKGWLGNGALFTVALIIMCLYALFHGAIVARLLGYDAGSAYSRLPLMKLAFRIIKDYPVLGVGANNFALVMPEYAKLGYGSGWISTVHNEYLRVWVEKGIGALIAFVWFLFAIVRRGWQCWLFNDRVLSPLALGFTAGILGQMSHMAVDIFSGRPQVQLLWLIAALITAMRNIGADQSEYHREKA